MELSSSAALRHFPMEHRFALRWMPLALRGNLVPHIFNRLPEAGMDVAESWINCFKTFNRFEIGTFASSGINGDDRATRCGTALSS